MTSTNGYLGFPSQDPRGAVLVLHAWWGLNDTIKAICDQLAKAGYVALAPDLYHGQVTDQISGAENLSGGLFANLDRPRAELATAAAILHRVANNGLAVIGFSLGAFFALDLSVRMPAQIRTVVTFYGTRPGDYSASQASYLGHFAETDAFEPRSEVDALEAALTSAGRPVTFHHYPGTGHWFFEPDRETAYDPAVAALAWERTLSFLESALPEG